MFLWRWNPPVEVEPSSCAAAELPGAHGIVVVAAPQARHHAMGDAYTNFNHIAWLPMAEFHGELAWG